MDEEFVKYFNLMKDVFVNLNMIDVVKLIPSFRKFLKSLLNVKKMPRTGDTIRLS